MISGSVLKENQGKLLAKVREEVGETFNCAPNRVGLVPNFSYGFNTFLEGIEKPKKVLLLKNDYPSINWPVASRDFEICYAEINEFLEENIVEVLKKEQPHFFAFSIVQYINGIKLSAAFLTQLKKDFPEVIFLADGTQFLGTEAFDFDASGIDVVISSTYKWLNAGYGNGFMLFNKDIEGKVFPKHLGFGSLQGKYKAHEDNFLGKFEPGHQDTLNYGSLGEALKLIKQFGISTIESQVNVLKSQAKQIFTEMNLLEEAVAKRGDHSSIFNIKGDDKLYHYLREKDIIVSQRGEGLRVSFHYFNTEEELEILVKALENHKG